MNMMTFREGLNVCKSCLSGEEDDAYAVAEAVMSPAKYALFQFLGYTIVEATFPIYESSVSSTISIKVGASGGIALLLVHVSTLLFRRSSPHDGVANYQLLFKEMICSAAGSVIGALATGVSGRQELSTFAIAGFIGPVVFLAILFGALGIAIAVGWSVERVGTRWQRQRFLF